LAAAFEYVIDIVMYDPVLLRKTQYPFESFDQLFEPVAGYEIIILEIALVLMS
jgi:hypothetical protein